MGSDCRVGPPPLDARRAGRLVTHGRALTICLVMVAAGCRGASDPEPVVELGEIRSVVLVSIDTCRAGYLSCYGYDQKTTPHIDNFASQATLFENVIAPAPMTLPSHSTMMTGTDPPYHGVHENLEYRLGDSNVTLAELLTDHGFDTGAVVGTFVLDAQFGLNQGFDHYDDLFEKPIGKGEKAERRADEVSEHAMRWLAEHADQRFFLFLHYYDPHVAYSPPEPFASDYADNLYAGEIAYTDHCLGQVLDKLKELKLYDSTLIIVTSDHGEMLGEHGEQSHSYLIYQSAVQVPLLVKLPDQTQPRRVGELVGVIDIMPTICTLLGIDRPPEVRGVDLSPALLGQDPVQTKRQVYCESLTPTKYQASPLLGIVTDGWKYIQKTQPELYDLTSDPQEMNNLIDAESHRGKVLQEELQQMLEQDLRRGATDSRLEADDQTRRQIATLGYAVGSVEEDFTFKQDKADPNQLLGLHKLHQSVSPLMLEKKFQEAVAVCQQMIDEYPGVIVPHERLADIAHQQGDMQGVIKHWEEVLRLQPNHATGHSNLGLALASLGQYTEAIEHYRKSLKFRPNFAQAHHNLARSLRALGKIDEATEHDHQAVRLNPNYTEAHTDLGLALAQRHEYDEAIKHYERAIASRPNFVAAHVGLADSLQYKGQIDEAIHRYELALEIDPTDPNAHNSLAGALWKKRELDEAMRHYQEALRLAPDYLMARLNLAMLFQSRGQLEEALLHHREALRIEPDWLAPLIAVAWILATHPEASSRQPEEALRLALRAASLSKRQDPKVLDTLAAAYAATGQFQQAAQTAQAALKRARAMKQDKLAQLIASRLTLYQQNKPYVQPLMTQP